MNYDFSAHFLRINPPDTSFGEAWESLCYALTLEETKDATLMRFAPPDGGVDFMSRGFRRAYQCKSDERGAFGAANAQSSLESLRKAAGSRKSMGWDTYSFATNANYTAAAQQAITKEARERDIGEASIQFLGPEYWASLCQKFPKAVEGRLDYKVSMSEFQVIEALREERYREGFIEGAKHKIAASPEPVVLKNNRTPIELRIPFSKELTIKQLLDVAKIALGLSLDWTTYADTKTSCGPSLAITLDRVPQSFRAKLGDLPAGALSQLELFITLVWEDGVEAEKEVPETKSFLYCYTPDRAEDFVCPGFGSSPAREALTETQRRDLTLRRKEIMIQNSMWEHVRKLKQQPSPHQG